MLLSLNKFTFFILNYNFYIWSNTYLNLIKAMNFLKIFTSYVFVIFSFITYGQNDQNVFISEFHYDNSGADTLEGFEISGTAETDLSCYTIYFYNGTNGLVYNQNQLEGIIPNQLCDLGAIWFDESSIQNGADAIALFNHCSDTKVQFLSYEGILIANDGPFSGDTSSQLSVFESNASIGFSLQFLGISSNFIDSLWIGPNANSIGFVNALNPPCFFSVDISNPQLDTQCQLLGPQELSVQLTNYSNSTLDTFVVSYSFQDSVYKDSLFEPILSDSIFDYVFQDSILFSNEGVFTIECWLEAINEGQIYTDSITFTDTFLEFDSLMVSDFLFNSCQGDTILLEAIDFNGSFFVDSSTVNWTTIVEQDSVFQLSVYNQCDSDSFSVNINVSELDLGADIILCNNDTIHISVFDNFTSYNWSSGDSISEISLSNAATLSLLVQDSLGCFLSDTIEVVENVAVDLGDDLVHCIGDTIWISSNFEEGFFQWSTGDSVTQIMSFSSSLISLQYTDQNGCISSDTLSIEFIDCDTSVVTIENKSLGFSIYPNPVKEFLFIENINNDNQDYRCQIFDSLGRVFYNENTSKSKIKLDVQNFQEGFYILQIQKNKILENHKILIL